MKLSEYCDKKEALWNEKEEEKVEKLIKYINDNINDDLFKISPSQSTSISGVRSTRFLAMK